jgi:hypothetical protein
MSVRVLLLTVAVFSTACANRGLNLHESVGESTVGTTRIPSPDGGAKPAPVAGAQGASNGVELYLAGESPGPCGIAPPIIEFDAASADLPESHLELGLARAQLVMKHLMTSGVAPGRIVVASAGELQRPHAE